MRLLECNMEVAVETKQSSIRDTDYCVVSKVLKLHEKYNNFENFRTIARA